MTTKLVLFFLTLISILGVFVVWLGFNQASQVFLDINSSADHTTFQSRVGLMFSGILLPVFHLIIIVEYFQPDVIHKRLAFVNRLGVILMVIFLGGGILFSTGLQDYVSRSGYQYCRAASSTGVFKTLVYTKDGQVCTRLAKERKAR